MALWDALTGDAGHQAAQNTRTSLAAIIPNLNTASAATYAGAGQTLQGGYDQARTDLGLGYNAATGAINTGATGALGYLDQGQQGALGQLAQARGDLTANGGAYAALSALAGRHGQGSGLYADALGINGAEGAGRATSAYNSAIGGGDFLLNQGIDAINRRRNAAGSLNGGNADRDAQLFGMNTAAQNAQQWLSNLSPYNQLELGATQGAAAGNQANNTTLANLGVTGANLLNTGGQNRAQIAAQQGNSLADIARGYYGGLAGNDVAGATAQAGNSLAGMQNSQNLFLGALPQWNNTYKMDADASNAASANTLGLGMNLAKLGAGAVGSMSGGSSFLPSASFLQNGMNWG